MIRLHDDRELDAETLAALQDGGLSRRARIVRRRRGSETAYANMAAALRENPTLDELAADYGDLPEQQLRRLVMSRSGSATSIWPATGRCSKLREIHAAAGWQVGDWRSRLMIIWRCNCRYLRRVLATAAVDPEELAGFIDEHIGYWLPDRG